MRSIASPAWLRYANSEEASIILSSMMVDSLGSCTVFYSFLVDTMNMLSITDVLTERLLRKIL